MRSSRSSPRRCKGKLVTGEGGAEAYMYALCLSIYIQAWAEGRMGIARSFATRERTLELASSTTVRKHQIKLFETEAAAPHPAGEEQ